MIVLEKKGTVVNLIRLCILLNIFMERIEQLEEAAVSVLNESTVLDYWGVSRKDELHDIYLKILYDKGGQQAVQYGVLNLDDEDWEWFIQDFSKLSMSVYDHQKVSNFIGALINMPKEVKEYLKKYEGYDKIDEIFEIEREGNRGTVKFRQLEGGANPNDVILNMIPELVPKIKNVLERIAKEDLPN